jgi:hypothetical protein
MATLVRLLDTLPEMSIDQHIDTGRTDAQQ